MSPFNYRSTTLTQRIKMLRARHHWTQEELSRQSGIALATIRSIEIGQRKGGRDDTIRKMAEAFGVTISFLKYGSEETEVESKALYWIELDPDISPGVKLVLRDVILGEYQRTKQVTI